MTKGVLLPAVLLAAVLSTPASAESQHIAIAPSQIAAAMTQAGFATSPDQVTLLANVVATTSNPILKVDSVNRSEGMRMRVRLSCKDTAQCLPFYVSFPESVSAGQATMPQQRQGTTGYLLRTSATASRITATDNQSIVKAGSKVILLLEGDHVHIQIHAVCLHNGSIGQIIRVASNDHREVYAAEILDAAHVRGRL